MTNKEDIPLMNDGEEKEEKVEKKEQKQKEIVLASPEDEFRYNARLGNLEKLKELSALNVDVNGRDVKPEVLAEGKKYKECYTGNTAAHEACRSNKVEVLDYLFSSRADFSIGNLIGSTPLHVAAARGNLDSVKKLLELGAAIEATNKIGNTALHCASYANKEKVVEYLLEKKATSKKNRVGMTPLDYAEEPSMKKLILNGLDDEAEEKDDGDDDDDDDDDDDETN